MKYLLLLLGIVLIGCGDERADPADLNATNLTEKGNGEIYTLEDHYETQINGNDVFLWGIDKAFGKTNEDASAFNKTLYIACGLRMLVQKVGLSLNDYTIKIGASDQMQPGCGQLRGNYTMTLTGPKSADIVWVSEDDETF